MTPSDLRSMILHLDPGGPVHLQLTADLSGGRAAPTWYSTQKEHWLGWLGEYDGPGAYGRANGDRAAAFVYNHFQCVEGLCWLAEAAGVSVDALMRACEAVAASGSNYARRCGAFRQIVPWTTVEPLLRGGIARQMV